jgi:MFS transporter, LAT3 family, solute carrier family 43, member 1
MAMANFRRYLLLLLGLFESALCSGIIFGWPSILQILIDEGVYSNLCKEGEVIHSFIQHALKTTNHLTQIHFFVLIGYYLQHIPCTAQTLRFNLVYTIGTFSNFVAPVLIGIFFDKFGPKITNILASIVFVIGAVLCSLSSLYSKYT